MSAPWNYDLFIDGEWTEGEGGGRIEVIDPATEEPIGTVAEASTKDAVRAIEAARKAFDEGPWPWMKPKERAAVLDPHGRDPRGAWRRAARADRRRDRLDRLHHRLRAGRGLDRHVPVERRAGAARGRVGRDGPAHRPAPPAWAAARSARAHRRRRRDHAVQLPVHAQRGEVRARAGGGVHGRAQAASVDPARRVPDRRRPRRRRGSRPGCST